MAISASRASAKGCPRREVPFCPARPWPYTRSSGAHATPSEGQSTADDLPPPDDPAAAAASPDAQGPLLTYYFEAPINSATSAAASAAGGPSLVVYLDGLSDGPHLVELSACDEAGNEDGSPASIEFVVDPQLRPGPPPPPRLVTAKPGNGVVEVGWSLAPLSAHAEVTGPAGAFTVVGMTEVAGASKLFTLNRKEFGKANKAQSTGPPSAALERQGFSSGLRVNITSVRNEDTYVFVVAARDAKAGAGPVGLVSDSSFPSLRVTPLDPTDPCGAIDCNDDPSVYIPGGTCFTQLSVDSGALEGNCVCRPGFDQGLHCGAGAAGAGAGAGAEVGAWVSGPYSGCSRFCGRESEASTRTREVRCERFKDGFPVSRAGTGDVAGGGASFAVQCDHSTEPPREVQCEFRECGEDFLFVSVDLAGVRFDDVAFSAEAAAAFENSVSLELAHALNLHLGRITEVNFFGADDARFSEELAPREAKGFEADPSMDPAATAASDPNANKWAVGAKSIQDLDSGPSSGGGSSGNGSGKSDEEEESSPQAGGGSKGTQGVKSKAEVRVSGRGDDSSPYTSPSDIASDGEVGKLNLLPSSLTVQLRVSGPKHADAPPLRILAEQLAKEVATPGSKLRTSGTFLRHASPTSLFIQGGGLQESQRSRDESSSSASTWMSALPDWLAAAGFILLLLSLCGHRIAEAKPAPWANKRVDDGRTGDNPRAMPPPSPFGPPFGLPMATAEPAPAELAASHGVPTRGTKSECLSSPSPLATSPLGPGEPSGGQSEDPVDALERKAAFNRPPPSQQALQGAAGYLGQQARGGPTGGRREIARGGRLGRAAAAVRGAWRSLSGLDRPALPAVARPLPLGEALGLARASHAGEVDTQAAREKGTVIELKDLESLRYERRAQPGTGAAGEKGTVVDLGDLESMRTEKAAIPGLGLGF
mmetsp:Transcript_2987/g.6738  ORF Transcript_2987/g.6738 Transcript_2987/m.6738 type:complete len:934 (-) Transcript_2987:250-3051(-)